MSDLLSSGERRILTVLIIDIVSSTSLAGKLDPEDYNEILERLGQIWSTAITSFEGQVIKWTGDGCVAVFGYPKAHNNDAIRSIAAGLSILESLAEERSAGLVTPDVRIGVHTGLILVHQVGSSGDFDVVGEAPAVAKRLEALAPANELLMSGATARRVQTDFELRSLGVRQLKGVSSEIEVWELVGRRDDNGFEAPLRLVGRDIELAHLMDQWKLSIGAKRQAVVITAGPGMGKSRLIEELLVLIGSEGEALVLRCSELMGTTALYPLVQGLRSLISASRSTPSEEVLDRLDAEFGALPNPAGVALVASLIGITPRETEALPVEPGKRRAELWESLLDWVKLRTERGPCCLVIEDLHWSDPSTTEFLNVLLADPALVNLFVVLTTRLEGSHQIAEHRDIRSIELGALTEDAASTMIEEIAGGSISDEVRRQLLDRSDSVPLYITELTRAVTEAGLLERRRQGLELKEPLSSTDIPASLADSLMMRLDSLGAARGLASAAATIGRTFEAALLSEIIDAQPGLESDLAQMVNVGVLTRFDTPGRDHRYTFSHELLRAAAYETLTRRNRKELHRRIAHALASGDRFTEPTVLAHHYTEATEYPEAIDAWRAAGRADFAVAAYDEAIANFGRGLALVVHLDPATSWQLEFPLQLGVALSYATRFGYGHRSLLERERLLVVGPNRIFLRYIAQILPSLGEVAATQLTVEGLAGARYRLGEPDPTGLAKLKGDRRMAGVVRRAVFDQVTLPDSDVAIATRFGTVTLRTSDVAAIVTNAKERSKRFNDGRYLVREQLVKLAWTTHAARLTSDVTRQAVFEGEVRSSGTLKTLLDKTWPTVSASRVLRRLYGSPACRQRSTLGLLTPREAASLARTPAKRIGEERWTRADLALLDEAEALLSGVRQTYGHIVVDEAQDLSAMELRMIARRSPRGSMTILGDLVQATSPASQTDWRQAISDIALRTHSSAN